MTTEIIDKESLQLIKQEESLKIEKNSKGYNWEYRLLGNIEEQIKRIENIEQFLISKINKEVKN